MPYIAYLPNIPYFPNMLYQTDHTHHTYPTCHTTPPPHHRGGRGKISYGGSIWDPSLGGRGGGRAWCIYIVIYIYTYYIYSYNILYIFHQQYVDSAVFNRPCGNPRFPGLSGLGLCLVPRHSQRWGSGNLAERWILREPQCQMPWKCHQNAKGSVEKTGFIVYVRSMNELFESVSPMARYTRHHATWSLLGLDAWQPFRCWCCGPWSASTKDWCAKNFHSKLIPLLAKKIHSWKTEEIYFCSPFGSIMN